MNQQKQNGNIIAIITMFFLFAMISFVTNLAAPFGTIWKNQYAGANTLGMMGNMMNFLAYLFMGIPSGNMLVKIGYKKTALIAMAVGFIGLFIQYISSLFGAGVNAWLSNSFGLGLQGEYLLPVQKNLPHFVQVSARVIWRIGGKSKKQAPVVKYVEIEKPVEVEKIVERIVEKQADTAGSVEAMACDLLDNIYFEFDKDVLTAASEKTLDRLAGLLKSYPDARFLITGYTDARGSSAYNTDLSNRRAKRVYEALLERGVPAAMLKWHGIGKRASIIPVAAGNSVREGDRKVLLERITNMKYWEAL